MAVALMAQATVRAGTPITRSTTPLAALGRPPSLRVRLVYPQLPRMPAVDVHALRPGPPLIGERGLDDPPVLVAVPDTPRLTMLRLNADAGLSRRGGHDVHPPGPPPFQWSRQVTMPARISRASQTEHSSSLALAGSPRMNAPHTEWSGSSGPPSSHG